MSRLKISVIVPVYNAGQYLRQCLTSLQVQTIDDGMEVIMVDNCSTDDSRAIMKEYAEKDKRFHAVYNLKNMGQNHSMRVGLEQAKGEYVAECDADDFVVPHAYELLYTFAKEYDLDVSRAGWFDFTDDKMAERSLVDKPIYFNFNNLNTEYKIWFLGFQCHIQSAIYRTDWIKENNLWYREKGIYEDTSLSFKIRSTAPRYGILPGCLYFYRRDNEQSGTYTEKNTDGIIEQYEEIQRFNDEHGLHLDTYIGVCKFYTYRWMRNRLTGEEKEKFIRDAAQDFEKDTVWTDLFCNNADVKEYFEWRNMMDPPV